MVLYFPGDAQNIKFSDPVMGANRTSTSCVCIFMSANLSLLFFFVRALNIVNFTRRCLDAAPRIQMG